MFKWGLIAVAFFLGFVWHNHEVNKAVYVTSLEYEARITEMQVEAQEASTKIRENVIKQLAIKDAKFEAINTEYNALLDSLRKRPSREDSPPNPARDCSSATGAELSKEDAGFLAGEAARAERILNERDYYYQIYSDAARGLAAKQRGND